MIEFDKIIAKIIHTEMKIGLYKIIVVREEEDVLYCFNKEDQCWKVIRHLSY